VITSTQVKELEIGDVAPDFRGLRGVDGTSYGLSSNDDSPILALVFIANGCPTVRVYDERLKDLQDSYGKRGVQIVAINSNNPHFSPPDVYEEMVKRAAEARYKFPYLKDQDGTVANDYGAIATPHAFVFDRDRCLVYRGRIDDSRDPSKITSHDLRDALDDSVNGRVVRTTTTQPFGCAIVR
jgi:peroxiredoxin